MSHSQIPQIGEEGSMQRCARIVSESIPVKQRERRSQRQRKRRCIDQDHLPPLAITISDRFPPELIDRILDHLHNDSCTLRSCCLTCRAWLASSRYHLFGNTIVRLREMNVPQFFQLFDAATLAATYIQHVEIDMWRSFEDTLLRLMGFVSITSLRLCRVYRDAAAVTSSSIQSFQTLTALELVHSIFLSFTQLRGILEALPLLQRICLAEVAYIGESDSAFKSQRPLPHLRELDFDLFNDVSILLRWLLSFEPIPAVTSLKLGYTCRAADVGRLLRAFGSNLDCLALYRVVDHAQVDLSQNYNLRTMHFNGIIINETDSAEWVIALLSQITSQQIEFVVFRMTLCLPDVLGTFDWDALAQILARPQFAGLRRIEVVVSIKATNVIKENIKDKLLTFHSRGILHVTQPQSPHHRRW